MRLNSDIGQIK